MINNELSPATIISRIRGLKALATIADLNNSEQVKHIIASKKWKTFTKRTQALNYGLFLKFLGKTWERPHFKPEERIPFIPTETEIDQLIASTSKTISTLCQTLKDTGARVSEATKLKWADLSTEQRTISITPSKGSNPRILPINDKLIAMLNKLPHNKETIFTRNIDALRDQFCHQRKAAAEKLQNPRIQQITFHTFRHWKATMEYHRTKDILHVKYLLGHKSIQCTLTYINIEQALYLTENDQFTATVAHNETEALKLLETGFEYVTDYGTNKLFRKRK